MVIPCFNQAEFLRDAIQSVLSSGGGDCEIIVIDDGSTDGTAAVARDFGPAIRYVRQSNRGLPDARNAGLTEATGDGVLFLDADDRLVSGALAAGVLALQENQAAAFAAGRYRTITEEGKPFAEPEPMSPRQDWYAALLRRNVFGMPGVVMYRRTVLIEEGGFDRRLLSCEDYDVYLRLTRAHPIAYHDAIVGEYRLRRGSMSSNSARMLSTAIRVLRSQPRAALNTSERRDAYREGLAYWRGYYGRRLLQEAHAMMIERVGPRVLSRDIVTLLQLMPGKYRSGQMYLV